MTTLQQRIAFNKLSEIVLNVTGGSGGHRLLLLLGSIKPSDVYSMHGFVNQQALYSLLEIGGFFTLKSVRKMRDALETLPRSIVSEEQLKMFDDYESKYLVSPPRPPVMCEQLVVRPPVRTPIEFVQDPPSTSIRSSSKADLFLRLKDHMRSIVAGPMGMDVLGLMEIRYYEVAPGNSFNWESLWSLLRNRHYFSEENVTPMVGVFETLNDIKRSEVIARSTIQEFKSYQFWDSHP